MLEDRIRLEVLRNAVSHRGKASFSHVFKGLMRFPEFRANVDKWRSVVERVVSEVNGLSVGEQREELLRLDPGFFDKRVEERVLSLPMVSGGVVMRFAPNPNGGLHIGQARVAVLNDFFVKKYGGVFILRFDDTDPKNPDKRPVREAYDWIKRDLRFLGVRVDKVSFASKRLPRYYEVFERLVRKGKAYVCVCSGESFRERRRVGVACPCRGLSIRENLSRWKRMLSHDFRSGDAVARVKTSMSVRDPAVRDWAAFRVVDEPHHPITGDEFVVWPLLDFASAVDDFDLGVTHILRGQDLSISERRQRWVYDFLGWRYPVVVTVGHVGFKGFGTFSKSRMRAGIKRGEFSGWDDPRLPMLASYERRGFLGRAVYDFFLSLGLTGGKVNLSESALAAINKRLVDDGCKRLFFVRNPVRFSIGFSGRVTVPNHPSNEGLGSRRLSVKGFVWLSEGDSCFDVLRLLYFVKVKRVGGELVVLSDQSIDKSVPKVQWVGDGVECSVLMPDGGVVEGLVERSVLRERVGSVFQFVRFGFVRLDSKSPLRFVFGHE